MPGLIGGPYRMVAEVFTLLTIVALAFITIDVGCEFDIDKSRPRQYGVDYLVAMTAAAFPWTFVTVYFLVVLMSDGSLDS